MRAMTFGALSGGGSDDSSSRGRSSRGGGGETTSDDGGGGSRSSSKNRFSKSLSRESTIELDDDERAGGFSSLGLSKSLSRLSVSSGGNLPPGGGILIKYVPLFIAIPS